MSRVIPWSKAIAVAKDPNTSSDAWLVLVGLGRNSSLAQMARWESVIYQNISNPKGDELRPGDIINIQMSDVSMLVAHEFAAGLTRD